MAATNMLKDLIYKGIAQAPLVRYWRRTRLQGRTVVLMYHELAEDGDDIDAWTVVRKKDFVAQVEYLRRHFNIVSLADAVARMQMTGGDETPMAVITFDDGDSGNHRVLLPLVRSLAIPVTIFVATRQVQQQEPYWFDRLINSVQGGQAITLDLRERGLDRYTINRQRGAQNWNEIERLLVDLKRQPPAMREETVQFLAHKTDENAAKGFYRVRPLAVPELQELAANPLVTIGAHSHCHNILPQLPDDEIRASVTRSRELLQTWTGRKIEYFAYPNGDHDPRVTGIVRDAGFRCALATAPRPWKRGDSLFAIPRISVGRYDTPERFRINLMGGVNQLLPWRRSAA